MKHLRITALATGLVLVGTLASLATPAFAYDPWSWFIDVTDGSGNRSELGIGANPTPNEPRVVLYDPSTHNPSIVPLNGGLYVDGTGHFSIDNVPQIEIAGLVSDLASKASLVHTHITSEITGLAAFVDARIASMSSSNNRKVYFNNSLQATSTTMMFATTTTSGVAIMYLTTDGSSTGTSTCPTNIEHVDVFIDDASNTYGLSKAITNSNKTLTVTANVRSFSSTTILGITVLGTSTLTPATNGTQIMAKVDCN